VLLPAASAGARFGSGHGRPDAAAARDGTRTCGVAGSRRTLAPAFSHPDSYRRLPARGSTVTAKRRRVVG